MERGPKAICFAALAVSRMGLVSRVRTEKKRREDTTFGVNLMRSQVLYQAAQECGDCIILQGKQTCASMLQAPCQANQAWMRKI